MNCASKEAFFDNTEILCLSPFVRPNPNYHSKNPFIVAHKDTWSKFINIPCGVCPQCIRLRQLELVQRMQMESLVSHLFFVTLTYSDEFLSTLVTSAGDSIPYVDFRDIDLLFKRIRNDNALSRSFRYFAVSERGGKKHRPHIHMIVLLEKHDSDDFSTCLNLEHELRQVILSRWSRNFGSKRKPIYKPMLNYVSRFYAGKLHTNYDCHYVNPSLTTNGVSDCAFYVLKYCLKFDPYERFLYKHLKDSLPPDEFFKTWSLVRSHFSASKSFGLPHHPKVIEYIKSCISRSDVSRGYPQFFSPDTGQSFPLCKYYRSFGHLYSSDVAFPFSMSFSESDDFSDTRKLYEFERFENIVKKVDEHQTQIFYDIL